MKISHKFFQKYIANIVIVGAILLVGILTYQGGVVGAFSSSKNSEPIFSGNAENGSISLMFNVYMGNEYVEQILQILEKNNVKATFFVGGSWVNKNEECFMKIVESGNEIGSHGYWHKDHSNISDQEQVNEIKMTEELIESVCGIKMSLFAPPSGAYNKATIQIANTLGYKTIMWSKDTIDWRDQDKSLIFTRATKDAIAGDLILCHPTKATCEALDDIISAYKNNGLKVTTVGENIKYGLLNN